MAQLDDMTVDSAWRVRMLGAVVNGIYRLHHGAIILLIRTTRARSETNVNLSRGD
jgi:hypothetical protein